MFDESYILYLAHFHGTRDYFECHEILEDRWKEEQPLNRDSIWVAFIQLAVSMYHYRRQNFGGANRLLQKSKDVFQYNQSAISSYGIDAEQLFTLMNNLEKRLINRDNYESINLPIIDTKLEELVQLKCVRLGCKYQTKSNLYDHFLLNKHSNRDRSDVIKERSEQLLKRNSHK